MDVMEFFRRSAGQWHSQRTTHHLPFRRAELGGSNITVEALDQTHEKVIAICELHEIDPALAVGGAYVTWNGAMAWDREGEENHAGTTVFALVPDADSPQKGRLLRERGYAEIVPVVGRYEMDDEDGLILDTEYDTMSSVERFWFVTPDLRMRSSIVKRFGGFNTASFCAETRMVDGQPVAVTPLGDAAAVEAFEQSSQLAAMGW
ncbi:phycobiliprotein lyase [Leptothoe sp. PORK10 BA2]|uniref:phycobiliprotein lyase n=1 Tax=Leptothoe sp. PORK10 BA2 TaxID=3110254 RepID=UPI002B1F4263|nr:phycobiliprotein lyase [Leptothoe sp. PORK10 BA2]